MTLDEQAKVIERMSGQLRTIWQLRNRPADREKLAEMNRLLAEWRAEHERLKSEPTVIPFRRP